MYIKHSKTTLVNPFSTSEAKSVVDQSAMIAESGSEIYEATQWYAQRIDVDSDNFAEITVQIAALNLKYFRAYYNIKPASDSFTALVPLRFAVAIDEFALGNFADFELVAISNLSGDIVIDQLVDPGVDQVGILSIFYAR